MATNINVYPQKWAVIKGTGSTPAVVTNMLMKANGSTTTTMLLIGSWDYPAEYKHRKITDVKYHIYAEPYTGEDRISLSAQSIAGEWDAENVVFKTRPSLYAPATGNAPSYYGSVFNNATFKDYLTAANNDSEITQDVRAESAASAARYGCNIMLSRGVIYTPIASGRQPYAEFSLSDDSTQSTLRLSNSGGFHPSGESLGVNWAVLSDGLSFAPDAQTAFTVYYKRKGGTQYTITGTTATNATIPGNRMTGETDVWVSVTLESGAVLTSDTITYTVTEAFSYAIAVRPDRDNINGRVDFTFEWEHVIASGTAPTKSELQIADTTNGTLGEYQALAVVEGSATRWVCPESTMTAGSKVWRVRTFNSDNAPGEWSEPKPFTVQLGPPTPKVNVDGNSRPTVTWQAEVQKTYEVRIDEETVMAAVGSAYRYASQRFLSQGIHTVSVRVSNSEGMWSEWGNAAFAVGQIGTIGLTLNESENGANLSWSAQDSYSKYYIYRNGIPIAAVTGNAYTDMNAETGAVYKVIGIRTGSTHGESNAMSFGGDKLGNSLLIRNDNDAEWTKIEYATSRIRETQTAFSRAGTFRHIYGTELPLLEISTSRDVTLSFEAAFNNPADAAEFERIISNAVYMRDETGRIVYGLILECKKTASRFWTNYEGSIRDTYRNEAIPLD